ncbi:MAG TPA: uroporphyrinogen decarboxylase [Acidimicrobiales bacterium]|nr:uroporphyrinogen decarboxylase [Acidimicrobiales bacterium]
MGFDDSAFIRACRRQPVDTVPVWFMRQAGRALPEYRRLRADRPFMATVADPEVASEITLQPVRRYGVDAAILFSDIVVPLAAIGVGVDIVAGRGPVVDRPFRSGADLDRLRPLEPEADIPHVIDTVKLVTAELDVPLIGFCGAPFTVASYLIEGGPSRDYALTKSLMRSEPELFGRLLDRLADLSVAFLRAQVGAGASAVQLFDSWAGALSGADYRRHVMPASAKVLAGVADLGVPRIHFGVGTGELLGLMGEAGADVVGVDWRIPLDEASRRIGPDRAVQGNLDPALCLAPWPVVEAEVADILDRGQRTPGHVFNLGHGVLPDTDPEVLARVVERVHKGPA